MSPFLHFYKQKDGGARIIIGINSGLMDERELKEAFLKGDREGFQKVVSTFSSEMMALSLNIVGNREDAEDVCQEAFLQAFRNSDRFDPKLSLRHWLLTIVCRRSLDLIRKKKRLTGFLNRFKQNFFLSTSAYGGLNREKAKLNGTEIPARAFDGLTVRQKVILTLWAREGLTSEEIAAIIGCRPATARVQLFLARQKIKKWLEKHHECV